MLEAKQVVANQFWILKENDQKIGNIEAGPHGYSVRINNSVTTYKNLNLLKKQVNINFQPNEVPMVPVDDRAQLVHGYATSSRPYNPVLDIKHQLPLYTTEPRSRSWSAAGWYLIKQHRNWIATFCPKLILLQRYDYRGPFKSKEEENESIS